jgi:hypothetical protein
VRLDSEHLVRQNLTYRFSFSFYVDIDDSHMNQSTLLIG